MSCVRRLPLGYFPALDMTQWPAQPQKHLGSASPAILSCSLSLGPATLACRKGRVCSRPCVPWHGAPTAGAWQAWGQRSANHAVGAMWLRHSRVLGGQ
jgi:hypothetical protein